MTIEEKADAIELRSDEVNEILSYIPNWVIRRGITVIFLVIILLIVLTYLVKYPDIIRGNIELTTPISPLTVVSPTSGKIIQLPIKNEQSIEQGQLLAIIDNAANSEAVLTLQKEIKTISYQNVFNKKLRELNNLGIVQTPYTQLLSAIKKYKRFIDLKQVPKKVLTVQNEIAGYKRLQEKLLKKRPLLKKQIQVDSLDYYRLTKAAKDGLVPPREAENLENTYLRSKKEWVNLTQQLEEYAMQITLLSSDTVDVKIAYQDKLNQLTVAVTENLDILKAAIDAWELKYVINAPIAGIIALPQERTVKQSIQANQELLTILPNEKQEIIGNLTVMAQGSGKLEHGQLVNIKLHDYLYHEYGMLNGTLKVIDVLPRDGKYTLQVQIDSLVTNYNKPIDFKQNMGGIGEVITEDVQLIHRIFNPFKALFKETF